MAAVFTPFSADGSRVLVKDIPAYAEYLVKNGVHGALVNGTTGEGMSLTLAERKSLAEAWIVAAKKTGIHVMVQVGGTNLQDVLELARHAETTGANSLLCLPELFNKPSDVEELVDYLSIVASAAPKTPLLYYHNPEASAVQLYMPSLLDLAGQRIKNFAGIKYTDKNLETGIRCMKLQGGAFSVFLGNDYIMAGAFALGINSMIATCLNVFPKLCVGIFDAVQQHKMEEARIIQYKLNDATDAVTKNGKWVPTMKAAMNVLSGFNMGPARAPLVPLSQEHTETMRNNLKKLKLL